MEQKFSNNGIDLHMLREFCKREGEAVVYRKGDQLEREGDPARWMAFVEHLDLQDIASFLNVTPKTISKIRKDITFGKD